MLVFKPVYDMELISQEVKNKLSGRITDRIAMLTVQELERERLEKTYDSSEIIIYSQNNQS